MHTHHPARTNTKVILMHAGWQILSIKFHKCMENKEAIPVILLGITYEATWVTETRLSSVAGQEPLSLVLVACGQAQVFPSEQDCSTRRTASRNSLMSMWPSLLKSMFRARSQIQSSVMSIFIWELNSFQVCLNSSSEMNPYQREEVTSVSQDSFQGPFSSDILTRTPALI